MTKVTIDFETRSRLNLPKVGQWVYSQDESTDVLCISFMIDDDPKVYSTPGFAFNYGDNTMRLLEKLAGDDDVIFEAHNAAFEYSIWYNAMHLRYDMPEIPMHRWRCSASVAAYKSLPRGLADLGKALDAPYQKDKAGHFVMMRMCKPVPESKREKHGEWYESEEDWAALMSYCDDDVRTEHACSKIIGELPPEELKLWLLDFKINMRGIKVDLEFAEAGLAMKQDVQAEIDKECKAICGWRASQREKIKIWFAEQGVEIPTKKDKNGVEKETIGGPVLKKFIADPSLPEKVRKVATLRRDHSTTSLAKLAAAIQYADSGGIVRGQFLYHGASTGRWSGKGIQFQNLPRGLFDEAIAYAAMCEVIGYIKAGDLDSIDNWYSDLMTNMEAMKSCLRGLVIARPKHKLYVQDFSQIEARGIAWLSGQFEVLQAFELGQDLYKFTAAQIYSKDYEEIDKQERFIGKTASLALGYQGGAGAFTAMALNMGVLIDKDVAEKIKTDWRKRNSRIVKFWYDLEAGAIRAVRHGKHVQVNGKIRFKVEGDYLTMGLPSGRKLWYYKPQVKEKLIKPKNGGQFKKPSLSYMGSDTARGIKWGRVHTYGGKLAENATQAMCRDLLAHAMFNLDDAGHTIIIHVHDEIVCEEVDGDLEEIRDAMLDLPEWAAGMPVDADGFETERYYKG